MIDISGTNEPTVSHVMSVHGPCTLSCAGIYLEFLGIYLMAYSKWLPQEPLSQQGKISLYGKGASYQWLPQNVCVFAIFTGPVTEICFPIKDVSREGNSVYT